MEYPCGVDMWRAFKQVIVVGLLVVFAGCSGGGCTSGCACGGITPLQDGFPSEGRVENAAAARLTDTGVSFLNNNLEALVAGFLGGEGVVEFPINPISGDQFLIKYWICEGGPDPDATPPECVIELDIGNSGLVLSVEPNHNIRIVGPLPVRLQNMPMRLQYFCPLCIESNVEGSLTGNQACPGDAADFAIIDVDVDVDISIDLTTTHARYGYSRARVNVNIDETQLKNSVEFCGSFDATILNALLDIIGGLLIGQITGMIDSQVEDAVCEKANPAFDPPCPAGTSNVDGICRYGTDAAAECVSVVLGMDGNVSLAALFGGAGSFDFLLAGGGHSMRTDGTGFAWGDLNPTAGGATLGLYGGVAPAPPSGCVPQVEAAAPTNIPIPDELVANSVAGWPAATPGPHVGFALSERFTNYAMTQLHQSGALCLGIGVDTIAQLTTALLQVGLGAPSMLELGMQKQGQPVAITIRPQKPPVVEVGSGTDITTDPVFDVTMEQASFDFYVWSADRYVRAMTATFDVTLDVNLEVSPDGLMPVIDNLALSNGTVTNNALLREDPEQIATALQDLVGGMVGDLLGDALPVVNLNEQLAAFGLELVIPPTEAGAGSAGLRKLTKDSDDFLGVFASLAIAPASTVRSPVAQLEMVELEVDPAGLRLPTWRADNGPRLRVAVTTVEAGRAVEHQYRLDRGPWHPFQQTDELIVSDPWLRAQGKHRIEVRSRFVGEPMSLDPTPASLEIVIDVDPPEVALTQDGGSLLVSVADIVSGPESIELRHRVQRSADATAQWSSWSDWSPALASPVIDAGDAAAVQVQARDEEENVGSVTHALIRGRGGDGGGCECRLVPASGRRAPPVALLIGLAALALGRRARRKPVLRA